MNKILSAVAKSYFAIAEEAVPGQLLFLQSMLQGNGHTADEDLPEDDFLPEQADTEPAADAFTGRIAVMNLRGVIMRYGGACSYGAVDYADRINQYAADDSISGLIVLADTPGGQIDGIETFREASVNFKSKKPMITLYDGMLCSGGVWALGCSTEVYSANGISKAGSVGVLARMLDVRKALEMNGIKEVVVRAPQSEDKVRTIDDALNGKTAELDAELEFICDRFLSVVETDRAGKITGDEWKTGKTFFAEDAQRIGLIDGIKSYTEVVARMQELIAENNKNNDMSLIRFPKLAALKKSDNITAESLETVNAEIAEYGIKGVVACLQSDIEALEDSETTIEALKTKVEGLTANNTDLGNQLTAKTTEAENLQKKVTALEAKIAGKPAEDVTAPVAEGDKLPPTEASTENYETSADRELAAIRGCN